MKEKRGIKKGLFNAVAGLFAIGVLIFPTQTTAEDITKVINQIKILAEQRNDLEQEISGFDNQIRFLEELITKLDIDITENEKQLTKIKIELEIQQNYLRDDLAALYLEDQRSLFELLLESNSFSDFVDRREYLDIMRENLKTTTDKINTLKYEAEKKQADLTKEKEIQAVAKTGLEAQKKEKIDSLSKVLEEEKAIRQKFSQRLSRAGAQKYCKGEGSVISAKNPIFKFPVNCGYISQGFGMTEFASVDKAYNGAIHNGFDVGVGVGTEIFSAGKGTVYAKGTSPSGGWGNWLIIKHNKVKIGETEVEFYSLYGHLITETHMKVGENVDENTIIGFVGGTPDWAPHLHFSLFMSNSGWSDGKTGPYPGNAVDPLDYMDIPISTSGTDWDPAYLHK